MGWKISVLSRGRGTCRAELERLGCEVGETFNVKEYDLALVLTAVQARRVVELAPHVRTVFAIHEGHAFVGNFKGAPDTLAAAFRAAHRILFVHEFQRDILFRPFLSGIVQERIAVIPNGALPLPPLGTPVRDPRRKTIVFLGSVYQRKRPQDLSAAVDSLRRDDVDMLLVGDASHMDTLGEPALALLRSRPEHFRVTGPLERAEALALCSAADIFCLPSADEVFPLSVLDAAALGIAPVLSDLEVHKGIWRHGVDCLMAPVGAVDVLAGMIQILLRDDKLRARLGQAAKANAARFSFDEKADQLTRLLIDVGK